MKKRYDWKTLFKSPGSPKKLNRSHSPLMLVLGLAFWWPCVFQADFHSPAHGSFDDTFRLALSYLFPVMLMAFAAFTAFAKQPRLRMRITLLVALSGGAGIVGYVLQTLSGMGSFSSPIAFQSSAALMGVCAAAGSIMSAAYLFAYLSAWLRLAQIVQIGHPLAAIALSYAITEAIQISLHFIPLEWQFAFRLACPLAASALLLGAASGPDNREHRKAAHDLGARRFVNGMLIASLAFICFDDLFSHLLKTASNPSSTAFAHDVPIPLFSLIIMIVLAAYLHVEDASHRKGIAVAFVLTTIVYMAILLSVIVLGDSRAELVDQLLVSIGHCLKVLTLIVLYWGIVHGICTTRFASGIFILIAVAAPLVLINLFPLPSTPGSSGKLPFAQAAGIALFAVSLILIVFNMRGSRHLSARTPEQQRDWLFERCRNASDGAQLTPKELEVMVFAYRGFTSKRIAEELGVSASTVDTHLKHAFHKLDVHSRQELIDLVDALDLPTPSAPQ
ncbi:helix-turn-helix domain-containing protein [Gordonibacter massiliensis (ex Traore et al. 2017)]|uniref:helix-turn-helix domain-containing protein n=1 Tax=Gordonibacter massiliensis (ex Traore et al. 2017) TaxID=1841863 RepID=UPI001C8B2C70|nr:helix-turn-helix transcriptional regulator [Gordonibacter massiliensis (ex Traore et al. 2017)]MBX9032919.1 helix-turn-helix transcriptional regulator [Gordonibacter massiliensis (ex Traore et al. 2017)]